MTKSTEPSGIDPSSISQQVRDYCREPKNSTKPECTCINEVNTFANTINCSALKINTCITGKIPARGESIDGCYADWNQIASAKQHWDKEVREVNARVPIYRKCKAIYDGIQNASWGDNAGPRLKIGNTRVEFGSLRRFCGKEAPGGSKTATVQNQQPPLGPATYFNTAKGLCPKNGWTNCCDPDLSFNMSDVDAITSGGLTQLETDYDTNVLPGFVKKPRINQDYHIVKWTGWSTLPCETCTSGTMDDNKTTRNCGKACTGNAQIEFLASRAQMCGWDDESQIPNYNKSQYAKNPETFDGSCAAYQPKGNSLKCCVNAVDIGKDVSGNISINQVCKINGEAYNGAVKAAEQEQKCKKNPDDPGCKTDCGPNQNCSGHGACVRVDDTGGKCKCGPDRSGKYCETCALTDSDCTQQADNSYANQEKCICECKPGYIGSVDAGVCVKDEKNKNIFEKISDWYNSIPMKTKIVILSGVTITIISIVILIVMISKSKRSTKLILK
jgi:hypothetical protein